MRVDSKIVRAEGHDTGGVCRLTRYRISEGAAHLNTVVILLAYSRDKLCGKNSGISHDFCLDLRRNYRNQLQGPEVAGVAHAERERLAFGDHFTVLRNKRIQLQSVQLRPAL